jgi:hypothetical protein
VGLAHEALGISAMKKTKKVPIQIYLDPDQFKMIDLLSKARNTSKAAIIRNCIAKYLESLPLKNDPALNNMNLGASGKKDISAKHDDYLIDSHFATAGLVTLP